jgi:elongation factor G
MKAIYWDEASQGMKFELRDIPAEYADQAARMACQHGGNAAEASEELMNKYLEEGDALQEKRSITPSAPAYYGFEIQFR